MCFILNRRYGHVEFSKEADTLKALELTGKYLKNRYIKVEKPLPPRAQSQTVDPSPIVIPEGCTTVFVKNLPYDVDEALLESHFKVFGPIASIRLPRWGHTNQLKGFGYVVFKRSDSAEICVKKGKSGGVAVNGRLITCDFETGIPKMSFQRQVKLQQTK